LSGTINGSVTGHGSSDATTGQMFLDIGAGAGAGYELINRITNPSSVHRQIGYNCLMRLAAGTFSFMYNASKDDVVQASVGLCTRESYSCGINEGGVIGYFTPSAEKIEMEWFGAGMSQAEFLTFQGIWDAFFTGLATL
jgi:hypothetical protein